jgi:hypothetical protein
VIVRILAAAIALIAASAPAFADQPFCAARVNFKREFAADIEGGYYQVGEDSEIVTRFRKSSSVAAEFKIIEPHRTEKFGTGVAFLFCDASLKRVVRVTFGDTEGSDKLSLAVYPIVEGMTRESPPLVPLTFLSVSKTATHRVTFRKDSKGQLIIGVGGEVFTVAPGFDVEFVRVQIYCSKSRVRFLDGDLVS